MDPHDAPWGLLARHLAAETSAAEQAALHEWLRASPQHLQILTTVTRAWERAGEVAPAPVVFSAAEVEAAWQRFRPKMGGLHVSARNTAPRPLVPVVPTAAAQAQAAGSDRSWGPVWRMAAGVALVAGAAYALQLGPFAAKKAEILSFASGGQRRLVELPDGSRVWLNARSSLRYSSAGAAAPRLAQLLGEGYFEVKKADGQPFVVLTPTARVRVVGTAFNVRAYAAEDSAEVSVTHGRVWLARRAVPADSVVLTAGLRAALHAADAPGQTAAALRPGPAAGANFRAWQTDTLRFADAPVAEVARTLRATFGTRVELVGKGLAQCRFTGAFAHPQPAQVLAVVQAATGAVLRPTGPNQFVLSGDGCVSTPAPASAPLVLTHE